MTLRMRSGAFAILLATAVLATSQAKAQVSQPAALSAYPVVQGKTFKFQKVAEGIYYAAGGTGSNHTIIVNDHDVWLVDDAGTPAATRDLLQDLKLITDKPVRYVINTHFHLDHTAGNQVFGPEVAIIAHEYVRTAILQSNLLARDPYLRDEQRTTALIESLPKQITEQQDPVRKTALEKQLADARLLQEQSKEIKPVPPNLTFTSKMVIYEGSREVQLLFLGRGHTAGDIVVYLPHEGILCSGDLVTSNVAYLGDAFFDDWVATLGELGKLDFKLVLPGHGRPMEGKSQIGAFQGYLTDLTKQVRLLRSQGVSPEDAAKRVDLTAYQKSFPSIQGIGADLRGVRRLYEWLQQTEMK